MIPDKIKINRIEDYHTHYLGCYAEGNLFWGYETYLYTKPLSEIKNEDWHQYRKEYAVLHLFDNEGNHINTRHWLAGTTDETDQILLQDKLSAMIDELGDIVYRDIEVFVFKTEIDGHTFGLVKNVQDGTIDLQPEATISFQEPWDGEYYT